eukprot:SAG25_NODE_14627_length_252_cov_1.477124_1_plen_22_part_01
MVMQRTPSTAPRPTPPSEATQH